MYVRIYPGVIMKESFTLMSPNTSIRPSGPLTETSLFIMGARRSANSNATPKHTAVKATDSAMYFHRMPALSAPSKRRVAISLERLPVRARLRFT